MMSFRVFESNEELARGLAETLVRTIESRDRTVVALSGGSTPKDLYAVLGAGALHQKLSPREVVWVVGDERCVPPDHPASNAKMIREALFARGIPERHRLLAFRTEEGTPEEIAARFEAEWRENGISSVDIAILGMGEDGHTASLFPETNALEVTEKIAAAVFIPKLDAWRVTVTLPELRRAAVKYVIAAGATKRETIERVRAGDDYPIARVIDGDGECWWFVDREAYG